MYMLRTTTEKISTCCIPRIVVVLVLVHWLKWWYSKNSTSWMFQYIHVCVWIVGVYVHALLIDYCYERIQTTRCGLLLLFLYICVCASLSIVCYTEYTAVRICLVHCVDFGWRVLIT